MYRASKEALRSQPLPQLVLIRKLAQLVLLEKNKGEAGVVLCS